MSPEETVANLLPPGAWDSHVHVVDEERFPFSPDYPYRPKRATLEDLDTFESTLGVDHVCLVCISVYGNDNRSILDALARRNRTTGKKARAVVAIDPATITDAELDALHEAGARGVRINLKTREQTPSKEELENLLRSHADRVRSRGWLIQVFLGLAQLELIADVIPTLGVRVVIDHMATPDAAVPAKGQRGYSELMGLLRQGQVYVKISGTYRFPTLPDLDQYGRDLMRAGPKQVVFASDWPHSGGTSNLVDGDRHKHQEYRKVDDGAFVRRCLEWCEDEGAVKRLFVDNPRELWLHGEKPDEEKSAALISPVAAHGKASVGMTVAELQSSVA